MIRSSRCQQTEAIHEGYSSRTFCGIEEQARKRLRWLDAATSLTDLAAIRGNRLEGLKGDRAGQHSIRINDRWRNCFSWREGSAHGSSTAQRTKLPPIHPGELLRDELNEIGVSLNELGRASGSDEPD